MINTTSEHLKVIKVFTFQHFRFYEHLKFHAQLKLSTKFFYNLRAWPIVKSACLKIKIPKHMFWALGRTVSMSQFF